MKDTSSIRWGFAVLLGMSLLLQGCDFFRVLAGKPTRDDLEELKEYRMEQEARIEAMRQARMEDSLKRVEARRAWVDDSSAVMSAMAEGRAVFKKLSELSVAPSEDISSRFCLMMGYFNNRGNAERLYKTMEADSLEPLLISFDSGATGVALFPCGSAHEILSRLDSVRDRDYFPSDSWIIWDTEKYDID